MCTYSDELIRVVHHSDEHVKQNHQRDDVVRAEHGGAHKFRELVPSPHVSHVQIQEAEYRPKQGLQGLK